MSRAEPVAGIDSRALAAVTGVAGALAVLGAFLTWIRIEVDGVSTPGSFETGLEGRDGRTIVVVGLLAIGLAVLMALGRSDPWLSVSLLVVGGVATIIAAVTVADVSDKADRIENEFGVPAEAVAAHPETGVWLVLLAGLILVTVGILTRIHRRADAAGGAVSPPE